MNLKVWFLETRPQYLFLSLVLVFLGTCIAWYDGSFNLGYALLAGLGLVLTHISANNLNDYFDYKSGIDLETNRTPFSGGSGILPGSGLKAKQVLLLGSTTLLLAVPIGVFFVIQAGWQLIPLLGVAALCVIFYTPVILKTYWPEWSPGLALGVLPVLGAYFVQTGEYTLHAFIASIPSFILVHNLLLLNEFPDVEADKKGGRKTTPIVLGRQKASIIYAIMTALVYVWIAGAVIAGVMPVYCLIAFLTMPFAIKAVKGAKQYDDMSILVPALSSNVMVVLLVQLLLGFGYILDRLL